MKDGCFGHKQYCTKVQQLSRFEKVYFFEFPNGITAKVSRDMTWVVNWFGMWQVSMVGSCVESILSFEWPWQVGRRLDWIRELE